MGSRDDFEDFFGDDDDAPVADTRADGRLLRVPLSRLAPNLVNPRTDFGTDDQLIDLGKSLARRQNQPCPVVSRIAYLKLWPDHAEKIGHVDYALVSGERRYRAAGAVGLPTLNCVVNDDFASSRKTFMEAVVSENVDRQNFDPIEEAYAVQALVREFGTNRAVAQHFERVDGWVTQRVLLTHLAPPIQDMVRKKAIPLEHARTLGKLSRDKGWAPEEQAAWWEEQQGIRQAAKQAAKRPTPPAAQPVPPAPEAEPLPGPPTPVSSAPEQSRQESPSFTAVKPAVPEVPEQRPEPSPDPQPVEPVTPPQIKMPWSDGEACANIAISKMDQDQLHRMIDRLLTHAGAR